MKDITRLDANQVIKNVFEETLKALKVVGEYDEIIATFLDAIQEQTAKATTLQVINPILTTANTKQTVTIPANTKKFIVRVRNEEAKLKVYQSASSTEYLTVNRGASYDSGDILLTTDLELAFETPKDNITLEIIYWS